LNRKGGAGATAAGIAAVIIVGAVGAMMFEGNSQQSQGGSGNIGSAFSNGIGALKSGLGFAAGGGLATVEAATVGLIAETFTGSAPIPPTCSATPKNSYIELVNTGSTKGTATGVTITYGGQVNGFSISGPCAIGPAGSSTSTMYVLFKGPSQLPNSSVPEAGQPFVGSVTLSNGGRLPFTGKFYSGYPSVATSGLSIIAADFTAGNPTNSSCGSTPEVGHSYIMLNNTGTVGANATDVTFYTRNGTSTIPVHEPCVIGPDGTASDVAYVLFGSDSKMNFAVTPGQSFNGTVSLSNRSDVPFKGVFQ